MTLLDFLSMLDILEHFDGCLCCRLELFFLTNICNKYKSDSL